MYLKLANKIDLQNVMLASLISIWLPALLGLFYSSSMIIFRIDRPLLGRMLAYGAPLMIMTFGFNMIFSVDKYILSGVVARDQFAVYSQAFRIAAIFSMLVSSFNFAFGPLSLSLFNKAEAPTVFAGLRTYYLLFMCLMVMIFIACGRIVILLLAGREYVSGCAFLAFFVMGYILYGLFSFGQMGIIYSKKSYLNLFVLVTGLVMTVVWDMLLVRHIKGYGTAAGFFLGNLTMVLLASSLSKRYLAVGYSNTKDIIVISFFAVFGAVSSFTFFTGNFYIDGLVKTVFGATLFCAMIMLPLFRSERALFKQVLSRSVSSQAFSEG
jgi:O-antigen/teichoic acid export membrane protein